MRTIVSLASIILGLSLPLAGCDGTNSRTERRARDTAPAPASATERETLVTISVKKVLFEYESETAHVGYIKVKVARSEADSPGRADELTVTWVYDLNFKPVGYYTTRGETYRLQPGPHGDYELLGPMSGEYSLRNLLGTKSPRVHVSFATVDPPRTIDGDREAAAKAAAEEKARKAKAAEGGASDSSKN